MSFAETDMIPQEQLPATMQAMILEAPHRPLVLTTLPMPVPSTWEVLVKVIACGICRTDLHVVDGELPHPRLPLIPGHEIVGRVVRIGSEVTTLQPGDLVGIPWLGYTCGHCRYCQKEQENLCENALFTGYTHDGGYAEYTLAFEDFCFPMPPEYANPSGAPLLCAGLIGYRSYTFAPPGVKHLGIYGFGAAAHILIQVALYEGQKVYAFTRDGDREGQDFARSLGATWAGDSSNLSPHLLDASIIFAPVGSLVPLALRSSEKGATVVCGGIHMSDIPSFPYDILWEERSIRSVANLTRKDGVEFLDLAARIPIHTTTQTFPLHQANEALDALRNGRIHGAAVLVP
ncbi:zinc-dependent alcohol dehydrogenase family protein [Puia dinghuensis]|uniref:alcohol dehydrogenase n=1 Tax=Puia dinghuensis TaxID=1792502 RepID=A0A8J2UCC3_9BACT|nr:zinc-dependent alcohol dehydrogenase family protein [Puia dinghuensis]GGA98093.1 alcohol dehydrogenase [Puia dinghuensis]